jgi:hypothetical protein
MRVVHAQPESAASASGFIGVGQRLLANILANRSNSLKKARILVHDVAEDGKVCRAHHAVICNLQPQAATVSDAARQRPKGLENQSRSSARGPLADGRCTQVARSCTRRPFGVREVSLESEPEVELFPR